MSVTRHKPWSQLEDEMPDDAACASASSSGEVDGPRRPSGEIGSAQGVGGARFAAGFRQCLERRLRSIHALFPVGLGLLVVLSGLLSGGAHVGGLGRLQSFGVLVCFSVAAVILAICWQARRKSLGALEASIARLGGSALKAGASSLGAELAPLWAAVERQTTDVARQLEQMLAERKGLGLELSMIEVQRGQMEAILRSLADPLLVTDAYDQLIFLNKSAEELFKVNGAEVLRKPIEEVLGNGGVVAAIRQAREAEGRVARRRVEQEIGGSSYAMTMAPFGAPGGESPGNQHHGVVVTLRDVSKERQASRMKSEFVAQAAHELRTPLSSISAYVEMLVDGEAADEKTRREYYEIIHASAQRLARLIDNILNISRIEAGTVRISKSPMSIAMVAKEALDMIRPSAEEKGLTLTDELPPVVYRVLADRDLLYQAILNLLSNAVKYTPAGGAVELRMIPQEECRKIKLEVRDSGVGIPKADLPRMFEKFFRVEKNKEMAKGTGLGLPLVKQIVEAVHDGELTLTSEEGVGSAFTVTLPLIEE